MANIDTMADQWVASNLEGLIADMYAGLFVGGEHTTHVEAAILTCCAQLQSAEVIGDLRFWLSAVFAAVVTNEHSRKIDEIRGNTYEVDLATKVPRIDDNTVNIAALVAGLPSLADEVIGVAASSAAIGTGVGTAIFLLNVLNLASEASALWQGATTEAIAAIPTEGTDISELLSLLHEIHTRTNPIAATHGYAQFVSDVFSGTNDPDTKMRLGQRQLNIGGHVATQMDGAGWLQDYLNAGLIAAPLAGLYETQEILPLAPVTVIECPRLTGIRINFTDIPASWGHHKGPPYRYEPLGEISYGRLGGFHGLDLLRFNPTVVQPFPAGTETVRIELYGELHGTFELIQPILEGA